ncbi:prepilin peptidase [Streptomyces sp. ISL-43]|uniref:prepilin peptidase n=1 Tax=Streptomyces sp. ISL-43 TaxID=2819183 RepID=UPI001BE7FAC8|nr:A24 family peptidase [Streptomyces sp. ISL-43]MBT2446003.1 prepilin peptidase [Streptomyces sp. ISL-43]
MDVTQALVVAGAAVWGVASGFLVPRAAYRLAVERDDAWRTGCPAGHPLTGPAGGWLGRAVCVPCGGAAGAYRPALPPVLVTAAACGALAAAVGGRPELFVWLAFAPFGVLLAFVDAAVFRLPDVLTLPLAALTAAGLGLAVLLPGAAGSWPTALLGGPALGGCYLVLFLINPRGMGFGDVKLALTLGQVMGWYGWPVLFLGTFAAFLAGAVHGLVLILLRRAGRRTAMPFGPFMLAGALAAVVYGGLG